VREAPYCVFNLVFLLSSGTYFVLLGVGSFDRDIMSYVRRYEAGKRRGGERERGGVEGGLMTWA
jgi:hypothetical protein